MVTFTIMGICTAIYLVTLICSLSYGPKEVWAWTSENLWLTPSESHWWTFLTSMFVHGGFFHLAGNMVFLFVFGSCVEDIIGRARYTLFYLVAGVVSSGVFIIFTPHHSDVPLGGASGAISACIGGFMVLLLKTKVNLRWFIFFFFRFFHGEFRLPAWMVISCWFLKDLANMILDSMAKVHGGGVAFGAHVGGTLFGAALMSLEKIRLRRLGDDYDAPEEEFVIATQPIVVTAVADIPRVKQKSVFIVGEKATIHLFSNGAQTGPFKKSQIDHMLVTEEISGDALYWQEGMADWQSVEELRPPVES